jgi:hypothetical protein
MRRPAQNHTGSGRDAPAASDVQIHSAFGCVDNPCMIVIHLLAATTRRALATPLVRAAAARSECMNRAHLHGAPRVVERIALHLG